MVGKCKLKIDKEIKLSHTRWKESRFNRYCSYYINLLAQRFTAFPFVSRWLVGRVGLTKIHSVTFMFILYERNNVANSLWKLLSALFNSGHWQEMGSKLRLQRLQLKSIGTPIWEEPNDAMFAIFVQLKFRLLEKN